MPGHIIIISGWRGAGKTTLCKALVKNARAAGWQPQGILSHAVFQDGMKTGIEIEDTGSGERRLLATHSDKKENDSAIHTCAWLFDEDTLHWGGVVFSRAVPCDLLVVDELGTLEMERDQGWISGLSAVDGGQYTLALVVIRPELLEKARKRWPQAEIFTVDEDGADPLAFAQRMSDRFFRTKPQQN